MSTIPKAPRSSLTSTNVAIRANVHVVKIAILENDALRSPAFPAKLETDALFEVEAG